MSNLAKGIIGTLIAVVLVAGIAYTVSAQTHASRFQANTQRGQARMQNAQGYGKGNGLNRNAEQGCRMHQNNAEKDGCPCQNKEGRGANQANCPFNNTQQTQ